MHRVVNTEMRVATWLTVAMLGVIAAGVAWHEYQWDQRMQRIGARVTDLENKTQFIPITRSQADSVHAIFADRLDSLRIEVEAMKVKKKF